MSTDPTSEAAATGQLVRVHGANVDLDVVAGQITAVHQPGTPPPSSNAVVVDWGAWTLIPGFVDQHCHGGGGYAFATTDPQEALAAARAHAMTGTTTVVASLVSAPHDELIAQVAALEPLVRGGQLGGIHLEGPWLSPRYRGAHNENYLRNPDHREFDELLATAAGSIAMVTLAPELPGAMEVIERLTEAGITVAIGHTAASYGQTVDAIRAGASVATHLFNAMPSLHHRDPGPIVALIEAPEVTVELIADFHHIDRRFLHWATSILPPERIALVTDAMAGACAAPGRYLLGDLEVDVTDERAVLPGTDTLAGSVLTMQQALRNLGEVTSWPLPDLVQAATSVPAQATHLRDVGELAVGRRADVVALDARREVSAVMKDGEVLTQFQ